MIDGKRTFDHYLSYFLGHLQKQPALTLTLRDFSLNFSAQDSDHSSQHFSPSTLHTTPTQPVNITLKPGSFVLVRGPSGCGKTSLLRTIAGFQLPLSGHVLFNRHDVTHLHPAVRDCNILFQENNLYPHLSGKKNLQLMRSAPQSGTNPYARDLSYHRVLLALLKITDLDPRLLNQPVHTLSGGEYQRLSIIRTLLQPRAVMLFDEPLSALPLLQRQHIIALLHAFHCKTNCLMMVVSHHPDVFAPFATNQLVFDPETTSYALT